MIGDNDLSLILGVNKNTKEYMDRSGEDGNDHVIEFIPHEHQKDPLAVMITDLIRDAEEKCGHSKDDERVE